MLLDDDPTGTQTVRDVPVVTSWGHDDILWALAQPAAGFFILTNSRSLPPDRARDLITEVITSCLTAAASTGDHLVFASRGDSTLRGHFPLETDAIADVLSANGRRVDTVLLAPAYFDAGRVTLDGVHWLVDDEHGLLPVADSEFAQDPTFAYQSSRLSEWVAEKSAGRIPATNVIEIGLSEIRRTPSTLPDAISAARERQVVVVDSVADDDLRRVAIAAVEAEDRGTEIVYRVGPSFARAGLGQEASAPLPDESLAHLVAPNLHSLVVVGSHVARTTRQLQHLLANRELSEVELSVSRVFDDEETYLDEVATIVARELEHSSVVLSTTRELRRGQDAFESLTIATTISDALIEVTHRIVTQRRPGWVVAKGGITSSEVATTALGIAHAIARGPLLPGIVSLWEAADGWAAGMAYTVFAGNVGDDDALTRVVDRLQQASQQPHERKPE